MTNEVVSVGNRNSKCIYEITAIVTHYMRLLAIFNDLSAVKLLSIAQTCFASVIVMLIRFKLPKVNVLCRIWSLVNSR
ncbi:hypothetical protein CR513_35551, partial [Mucuna pruriens]